MTDFREDLYNDIRYLLSDILGLSQQRVASFRTDTPLFGALPELDSLAATNLLAEIEERYGLTLALDKIDANVFATFGALCAFVESQRA